MLPYNSRRVQARTRIARTVSGRNRPSTASASPTSRRRVPPATPMWPFQPIAAPSRSHAAPVAGRATMRASALRETPTARVLRASPATSATSPGSWIATEPPLSVYEPPRTRAPPSRCRSSNESAPSPRRLPHQSLRAGNPAPPRLVRSRSRAAPRGTASRSGSSIRSGGSGSQTAALSAGSLANSPTPSSPSARLAPARRMSPSAEKIRTRGRILLCRRMIAKVTSPHNDGPGANGAGSESHLLRGFAGAVASVTGRPQVVTPDGFSWLLRSLSGIIRFTFSAAPLRPRRRGCGCRGIPAVFICVRRHERPSIRRPTFARAQAPSSPPTLRLAHSLGLGGLPRPPGWSRHRR